MTSYQEFLESKRVLDAPSGFDPKSLNLQLFDFQKDIVRWALRRGRAAIFADCGLGKTPMQLEWANQVCANTLGKCLILTPLAVSYQTVEEGRKFGIDVNMCRTNEDVNQGINVTNYEKLEHFNCSQFNAVVLDESSILKNYSGKFRNKIIEVFAKTPYRLACTATPAPNDYMELGNHAEFLGVLSRTEMLSMFFVHDGGETSKWRLKGHAESDFWKWLSSWAVYIRKPSDLGYSDQSFKLPELNTIKHRLNCDKATPGYLFAVPGESLNDQRAIKRASIADRVAECAELVNASNEHWVVWCELNDEANMLEQMILDSVQVAGSDDPEKKETRLLDFSHGKVRVLITKPSIAGHGMNWQHCRNMAFVSLSHSYESFYQAIRRCWRFGQERPVNAHVITMNTEDPIVENINRKQQEADRMAESLVEHMSELNKENIKGTKREQSVYKQDLESGEGWSMMLGDSVELCAGLEKDTFDYSIFSPPFASLYTYSNSERDMGNCVRHETFSEHFEFLVKELYRIIKPGRLLSFHCMNLPHSKERDGFFIGIRDFRGELVRMFVKAGWIFHSEVCIWKDPVTAMQRTKAIGLLYKQLRKDSALSRQGIPDYLVTMRKPGANAEPITKTYESFPVAVWQRYASPVWFDINPSRTLQSMREEKDERHICPLQLEVIDRALELWTNPDDLVLSPFAGIGSEGYESLKMGRRFVGIELKEAYFNQAVKNLKRACQQNAPLFSQQPSESSIDVSTTSEATDQTETELSEV
jgi:superfamily II DNA or RNA helicase